jgi:hypothetical protein
MDNVDDTDTYVLLSQPTSRFKLGLRVDNVEDRKYVSLRVF